MREAVSHLVLCARHVDDVMQELCKGGEVMLLLVGQRSAYGGFVYMR